MNNKTIIYIIATLLTIFTPLSVLSVKGQKINISLPEDGNKKFSFVIHKGIDRDTIQSGTLNFVGNTTIQIPESEKSYVGMGSIQIEGSKQNLSMIINNENFSVTQASSTSPYIFTGSQENDILYGAKKDIKDKNQNLYVFKFIELIQYMSQLNNYQKADINEKANIKIYTERHLDMEALYASSIWHNVVDALMRLNINEDIFVRDINKIADRINSPEILNHFAENIIAFTQQYGLETAFEGVISHIKDLNKIEVPQGKVYEAFLAVQVRTGSAAPDVVGLKKVSKGTYNKTLLIFHQPDCLNCQEQMKDLIARYDELKSKKVRIVTISSDHDKEIFKKENKKFPWNDNLCDFQGYAGPNYMNFGIMATPTYFLLDADNVVVGRYGVVKNIPF